MAEKSPPPPTQHPIGNQRNGQNPFTNPVVVAAFIGLVGVLLTSIIGPIIIDRFKATPTPTMPVTPTISANGFVCPNEEACIKGNVDPDTNDQIYHFPGCKYYEQTIINESKGEKYFTTAAEAEAAGWRKALNCP